MSYLLLLCFNYQNWLDRSFLKKHARTCTCRYYIIIQNYIRLQLQTLKRTTAQVCTLWFRTLFLRYVSLLSRYGSICERYCLFLERYLSFIARYGSHLVRYVLLNIPTRFVNGLCALIMRWGWFERFDSDLYFFNIARSN